MKTVQLLAVILGLLSLPVQGQVSLKLNLENGKTYRISQVNTQNMKQSVSGQQFSVEILSRLALSFKVLSQEAEVLTMAFTFDTTYNKATSPMGSNETNSALPPKKKEGKELLMHRLCTLPVVAKISTSGKFQGFVNFASFKDSLLKVLDSVPANKQNKARKVAEAMVKESQVQSMIEPYFAYLPDNQVSVNDTWETSYVLSVERISLMMFNTFTLKGVDNNTAQLTSTTETESIPSNDPTAPQTAFKGTSTGTWSVDLATGLVIGNQSQGHTGGTMTVKRQDKEMELQIESDAVSAYHFIK